MDKITVSAPAKINLALCVTGKRPDGYHTLKTVMQSVSLCDTVTAHRNNSGQISVTCSDGRIPCDERNIACKAAEAFFRGADILNTGIAIHIDKKIPSEAGLGGGSADGAAVLCALNKLFGAGLGEEELCRIGVTVGADIPFCIKGGTALCEGIGEIITPLPPLPDCFILIAKGNAGISTKEAFIKIDSLSDNSAYDFDVSVFDGSLRDIVSVCSNEFEAVSDIPEITEIKRSMLDSGALASAMSGSGSAVFGIFASEEGAEKCRGELSSDGFFAEVCRPLAHGVIA